MRTLCGVWYYVLMKNKYIYIDESGDTGYTKKSTRYFILTGVIVNVVLARMDTRNKYNKRIVDMFKFYGLNLILSTPTREKSLQIADFYSWCVFTNIEHGFDEYFLLLPNIVIFR
jgi:hypothetical protein